MRSFTVLALIAIVSSAFAVHLSPKQSAFLSLTNDLKASKSPLATTITGLLSLRQDINDNSEVVDALNTLRNELEDILGQTEDLYQQAQNAHQSEADRLQNYLGGLTDALNQNQAELADDQDQLAQVEAAINANEDVLTQTNQQIDEADQTRAYQHDVFLTQTSDIAASLEALGEAVDIVQEVADQDLDTVGFQSLLQTSTNKVKAALSKVEARLRRSKASKGFLKVLAQIMAKGVNQQVAQTIIDLLNEAIADLNTTNDNLTNDENNAEETYQELRATLVDRKNLAIDTLNNLHQQESDLQNSINALNNAIDALEGNIQDANDAINAEADNWAQTDAGYNARINRANGDIALLDKAVARLA